jgi:hypothetical protein
MAGIFALSGSGTVLLGGVIVLLERHRFVKLEEMKAE